MSFYSQFADHYEAVFPFQEDTYVFLKGCFPVGSRRILDAGCGTGHYCGRLAAEGYDTVGIDLDPQMIRVAQARYPVPEFRCMNMVEIGTLAPSFDAAFCIGNTAAHLTAEESARLLTNLAAILRPGGTWIVQTVNWDFVLERDSYRFPPKVMADAGVTFLREYRDISPSRLRFCTTLVSGDRTLFAGDVWLYPVRAAEYIRLHDAHGFSLVGHYADFKRSPFTPEVFSGSVFVFEKT